MLRSEDKGLGPHLYSEAVILSPHGSEGSHSGPSQFHGTHQPLSGLFSPLGILPSEVLGVNYLLPLLHIEQY